ncbi:rhomboid family intramembrane serine protease [Rhizobium mesosinicum]|uniref:Rhomboid family intramembrane serine protease n=1 Tax=Rhizobium mesosinicum TaxID=335017 RepID=A0ABS7GX53_9HYPH|nr:rhomboid family intramembrane serine protease [Rhizobium mesosinicum]MBW9054377.1 rhomboid family intramembrane serine protease [Rhizobium mesosinicum]
MFIPLHDANTLKHIKVQWVTLGLMAANIAAWLFTAVESEQVAQAAIIGLGYIPAIIFGHAELAPGLEIVPEAATYITYSFIHMGFWHLAGNMIFLWVFGDNVEDAMGHLRFLAFYLACAAAGAFCHGLLSTTSEAPLVGASGAISGVVAAYLMLHPRVRVWVLVFFRVPLPLPAFIPLLLWVGQQFFMLLIDPDGNVSWGAHVGGIIGGTLLILILRRPGVPLFDRQIVMPRAVRDRPSPIRITASGMPVPLRLPWDRDKL